MHIPFCRSKCRYCVFVSLAGGEGKGFEQALIAELERDAELWQGQLFDSIFFGGGTPSILKAERLPLLLAALRGRFGLLENCEITVEANPESLDERKLEAWQRAGINRLSIGLQAGQDRLLRILGRPHTAADFFRAAALAQRMGFERINGDLIYGLPEQTMADWLESLDRAIGAGLVHMSCYALQVEEGTALAADIAAGRLPVPDEDLAADMADAAVERLEKAGLLRYEISNFAQEGQQCRHNLHYWRNEPYAGFGPAAHGSIQKKDGWARYGNDEDISGYLHGDKGREWTAIDRRERMFETIMLGTRLVEGVDLDTFEREFGIPLTQAFPQAVSTAINRHWAVCEGGCFRLSKQGMDRHNAVALLFLET